MPQKIIEIVLLVLLCLAGSAYGSTYPLGTVDSNGYVLKGDGYWWRDGLPFLRTIRSEWVRDWCGYRYQTNSYSYRVVTKKLSKIPDASDRIVAHMLKLKERQQKHNEIMELMRVSGLEATYSGITEAVNPYYQAHQQYYAANARGNTNVVPDYAYSNKESVSYRRRQDLIAATNWYGQTVREGQAAASANVQDLGALAQIEQKVNESAERLASVRDLVEALANLVRESDPGEATMQSETHIERYSTEPIPEPPEQREPKGDLTTAINRVLSQNCIRCHSSQQPIEYDGEQVDVLKKTWSELFPKGVNLTDYWSFSDEQKQAVRAAIDAGSMPPDGKLSKANRALFAIEEVQR